MMPSSALRSPLPPVDGPADHTAEDRGSHQQADRWGEERPPEPRKPIQRDLKLAAVADYRYPTPKPPGPPEFYPQVPRGMGL